MQLKENTHHLYTNFTLKFSLRDDPGQRERFKVLMSQICNGITKVEIKDFVLLESVWGLDAAFHNSRDDIAEKLISFLNFSGILNTDRSVLIYAHLGFKETRMDLADCLLAAYSSPDTSVVSFDKDLR